MQSKKLTLKPDKNFKDVHLGLRKFNFFWHVLPKRHWDLMALFFWNGF